MEKKVKEIAIIIDEKSSSKSEAAREDGNRLLKKNSHNPMIIKRALSCFSKSAAYALQGSEELALAYNNRSVLFYHIKQYTYSLIDITNALKFTKSTTLKIKLLLRRMSCLNALGMALPGLKKDCLEELKSLIADVESPKERKQFERSLNTIIKIEVDAKFRLHKPRVFPEMTRSPTIPCASDAVEIRSDTSFRKKLIVNRFVSPGEILIIEDPYVTFPDLCRRYLYCSHCLGLALCAIPCDFCPCIVFCSQACKDNASEKYHNIECIVLKQFINHFQSRILMLTRCLIIALKENDCHKLDVNYVVNENKDIEENQGWYTLKINDLDR